MTANETYRYIYTSQFRSVSTYRYICKNLETETVRVKDRELRELEYEQCTTLFFGTQYEEKTFSEGYDHQKDVYMWCLQQ